ncbi:hypothetical protein EVAR_57678_1 [Eumeta japonica]|uniref:Uncharacterized protein n=1 Tax=Eumeta variegata TaxID=151549 RepID=A0A4C1YRE2_EUMVA|nr:hypothetical protein EVAR_57678_1 [Eumeta japonica]
MELRKSPTPVPAQRHLCRRARCAVLRINRRSFSVYSTQQTSYCFLSARVAAGSHFESVTLGNVTMSHRTTAECLSLSHSTMIGLRAQH